MVIQAIYLLFFESIKLIVNIFNPLNLGTDILTSVAYFIGFVSHYSYLMPLQAMMISLNIVFTYYSMYFGFSILSWVLRKIPILNMS
jgi:divalent metal cation (Fe/Co/Zn/Cd) transporter